MDGGFQLPPWASRTTAGAIRPMDLPALSICNPRALSVLDRLHCCILCQLDSAARATDSVRLDRAQSAPGLLHPINPFVSPSNGRGSPQRVSAFFANHFFPVQPPGGPPVSLAGGYQQRAPPLRCRCNSMPPPGPAQPVSLQCHLGPCQCCCILGQPPGAARSAALGAARASPCLHSSAALKPQRRRRPFCRLYIFAGPSCFLSPAACRRRRC